MSEHTETGSINDSLCSRRYFVVQKVMNTELDWRTTILKAFVQCYCLSLGALSSQTDYNNIDGYETQQVSLFSVFVCGFGPDDAQTTSFF